MLNLRCTMRPAEADDLPRMEQIRVAAFAPVFASFQSILGDTIYRHAQAHEDAEQGDLLMAQMESDSAWEMYVAELNDEIVGFVSVRLDQEHLFGEIGLNAIDPTHAGQGLGTQMYEFANARMKEAGMKVSTVATGGDPSHAAARRAYAKAGFDVEIPSTWMCRTL